MCLVPVVTMTFPVLEFLRNQLLLYFRITKRIFTKRSYVLFRNIEKEEEIINCLREKQPGGLKICFTLFRNSLGSDLKMGLSCRGEDMCVWVCGPPNPPVLWYSWEVIQRYT